MSNVHPLDSAFANGRRTRQDHDATRAGLAEDNYDPSHFYIKSTDGRGHGEKMSLTVPPEILGRIQAMIETRKFPYRTTHDFIRDAVLHRLHQLNDVTLDPVLGEFLNQQRLAHVLEQQQLMVQQAKAIVEQSREHFQQCWNAGDMQMLVDGILAAWQTLDGLREPYRSELRRIIAGWERQIDKQWRIELVEAGVIITGAGE